MALLMSSSVRAPRWRTPAERPLAASPRANRTCEKSTQGPCLSSPASGRLHAVELDLLVIGSGPSGQKAAVQAAKLGKRVAIAERRNRLGGVSIHTGTIPSKTLRQATLEQLATRPLDVLDPSRREESERQAIQQLLDRAAAVVAAETAITREQFGATTSGCCPARRLQGRPHGPHRRLRRAGSREPDRDRGRHAPGAPGVGGVRRSHDHRLRRAAEAREPRPAHDDRGRRGRDRRRVRVDVRGARLQGDGRRPARPCPEFLDSEIGEAFQYLLRRRNVTFRLREKVEAVEALPGRGARLKLASGKEIVSEAVLYATGRQGDTENLDLGNAGPGGRQARADQGRRRVPDRGAAHLRRRRLRRRRPRRDRHGAGSDRGAARLRPPVTQLPRLIPTGVYAIPELALVGCTEEELTDDACPTWRVWRAGASSRGA